MAPSARAMRWHPAQRLVWVSVFVVACGGGDTAMRVAHPTPVISVVEAGAAPRRMLRYVLTPSTHERFELEVKQRMTTTFTNTVLEEGQRSTDLPTVRVTGHLDVTAVAPSGEATIASVIEAVTVLDDYIDPAVHARAVAAAAAFEGARLAWRMDPMGQTTAVALETPEAGRGAPGLAASFADALRETAVVFPAEEVGVGATWRVVSSITVASVVWTRTVTHRLTALSDTSATILSDVVMDAAPQAVSVEPNATTRLTAAAATSTGELRVRPQAVMGTGSAHGRSEMSLLIVDRHVRLTSTVRTETLTSIRSEPRR